MSHPSSGENAEDVAFSNAKEDVAMDLTEMLALAPDALQGAAGRDPCAAGRFQAETKWNMGPLTINFLGITTNNNQESMGKQWFKQRVAIGKQLRIIVKRKPTKWEFMVRHCRTVW